MARYSISIKHVPSINSICDYVWRAKVINDNGNVVEEFEAHVKEDALDMARDHIAELGGDSDDDEGEEEDD